MLKDMQMDVYGSGCVHIDLHEIDMDTKTTISVPVEAVGDSKGVIEGGLLQIIRRELDVICKPTDTPDSIKIDVTELEIGDSVHVEDIDLGENVDIPHEVNYTIITIVPPVIEEIEVEEEEEEFFDEDAEEGAASETEEAEQE